MAISAKVKVTVKLDRSLLNPFLMDVTAASAKRAALRVRDRARTNLVRAQRMQTGKLYHSIRANTDTHPAVLSTSYTVGTTLRYATYQENGTRGSVARPGGWLRFKPKGSNVFIFRKRVRGIRPAHFLRDAYRALRLADFLP